MEKFDFKKHWENVYLKNDTNKLGWYEENPEQSMYLIEKCKLNKEDSIFNIGAGTTTLIKLLLKKEYKSLIINDISTVAIKKLIAELSEAQRNNIKIVEGDITIPGNFKNLDKIDLWHDRAVLHFFTKKEERDSYFDLLKELVKPKGYVIIAVFKQNGAEKCSGLPVYKYDKYMLKKELGCSFELLDNFDYSYTRPDGDTREFIYTLFQKSENC